MKYHLFANLKLNFNSLLIFDAYTIFSSFLNVAITKKKKKKLACLIGWFSVTD